MPKIIATSVQVAIFVNLTCQFTKLYAWCAICVITAVQKSYGVGCIVEQSQQVGKKWYVVLTKPRNEESAQFHLNAKGIEVFYPKLFLPVSTKAGRHIVPLFPNYIFVRIDAASTDYSQVVWCRGIKKLVSFGGTPSSVENNVIEFMRDQADPHGLIVARSNLKVGDEVQIAKGPFKGLVGIIQEPPDTKTRVKILMAILSRHVQVEVPAGYINIGWVAPVATYASH